MPQEVARWLESNEIDLLGATSSGCDGDDELLTHGGPGVQRERRRFHFRLRDHDCVK